jgi:hypothetical protein
MSVRYKFTDNIDFSWDRNYKTDAWAKGYRAEDVLEKILSDFDFGEDLNINQRFSVDYRPRISNWLTPTFRWSSDFNYTLSNPTTTREGTAGQRINKQLRIDFKPATLFEKIYTPKKKYQPPQPKPGGGEEEEAEGEEEQPKSKPVKLPNPFILAWRFLNAWKSITVDLNAKDDFDHYNLVGVPVWQYQFGFNNDPGVDTSLSGNRVPILPGVRKTRGINSGLQFDLIRNLSSNFKYRYDIVKSQTNQRNTESVNSSYFFSGENPEENRKGWNQYIPDWTLRLSGVEKFLFFGQFAKNMTLEHARTGKFTESSRVEEGEKIRENWSFSNSFQPLVGVSFGTHFGVTGNFRLTSNVNYNYNPSGAVTRTEQSGYSFSASYSVSQGFRLPLPFLSKKKLKNEIQFSLAFDNNGSKSASKGSGEEEFVEREVNKTRKIRPSATYRFSQKVNGTAFFETGSTETKRTGKYSYVEFGINMNIAIR